jgi:hypothetical protein
MMMRLCSIGLVAACFACPQAPPKPAGGVTLYFFIAPMCEASAQAAQRAAAFAKSQKSPVSIRPVLLLEDFSVLRKVEEGSPLAKTFKELQSLGKLDVPLYDEEGLELAQRWEIRAVPAFVLVAQGRAHRVQGPGAKLEEILECKP